MTDERELAALSERIEAMGGVVHRQGDEIRIAGIPSVGPYPMSLIAAAELMRQVVHGKVGAAILGFRGAIRCCRDADLDERQVFELVLRRGAD